MKIICKEEFLEKKEFYLKEMQKGKIFVYPTDTIYGIGCDALNCNAVQKIRGIKKRDEKPFSVIAPEKKWIKENCIVNINIENWIDKLPGPYTLILELRNKGCVSSNVNNSLESLGVRIPDNWFSKAIEEFGSPFITTSVNVSGEPHIKRVEDINTEIIKKIDYFIDQGTLEGQPSKIVKFIKGEIDIILR